MYISCLRHVRIVRTVRLLTDNKTSRLLSPYKKDPPPPPDLAYSNRTEIRREQEDVKRDLIGMIKGWDLTQDYMKRCRSS